MILVITAIKERGLFLFFCFLVWELGSEIRGDIMLFEDSIEECSAGIEPGTVLLRARDVITDNKLNI